MAQILQIPTGKFILSIKILIFALRTSTTASTSTTVRFMCTLVVTSIAAIRGLRIPTGGNTLLLSGRRQRRFDYYRFLRELTLRILVAMEVVHLMCWIVEK